MRKVLGAGGDWKRVRTFWAGDKGGDASLRGAVPHFLRGVPGFLRDEGLRRTAALGLDFGLVAFFSDMLFEG